MGWWCLGLWVLAQSTPAKDDRPFVEVIHDTGSVSGPSEAQIAPPHWERVQLDLLIENRLAQPVFQLEFELTMVRTPLDTPIPGWSFVKKTSNFQIPGGQNASLRINQRLPPRKTSPPADQIAYRVRLDRYRLDRPNLETAMQLLGSQKPSDQRSALASYVHVDPSHTEALGRELAEALQDLPDPPEARSALRMLFAIRALGTLQATDAIERLLRLPDDIPRKRWGRAVIKLAEKMVEASQPDDPRLQVLPVWARERTALLRVRAEDAISEVVQDALLQMGDAAVPELLRAEHLAASATVRTRARRTLQALGRSTLRAQLALHNRADQRKVMHVLGQIGSEDALLVLAEQLHHPRPQHQATAKTVLEAVGPRAIAPLLTTLGHKNDAPALRILKTLAEQAPRAMRDALKTYAPQTPDHLPTEVILQQVRDRIHQRQRIQRRLDIERALNAGARREYAPAFRILDRIRNQDSDVYQEFDERIAELYERWAEALLARGDYDAAARTAEVGLTVHPRRRTKRLLAEAQTALVKGYLELEALESAQDILAHIDRDHAPPHLIQQEAQLQLQAAARALALGQTDAARPLFAAAQPHLPEAPLTHQIARRLFWADHAAKLITTALAILLLTFIGLGVYQRQRVRRKLERLAAE